MDRNEMRFTAALALLRDGMALMISKHMSPTVDDINSAVGFAVETADDLLRELDEAQEPVKDTLGAFVEPERVVTNPPRRTIQCIFEQHRQRCQDNAVNGTNYCAVHGQPAIRAEESPKATVLAVDQLAQALYDWSSGRIDEPSCTAQATRYLNGYEVSPLIKTVFDHVVAEAKERQ